MKITGNLEDVGLAEVMQVIHFGRRSGTLRATAGARRAEIGFQGGQVVGAWAEGAPRLGELLVGQGVVAAGVVGEALALQPRAGRTLGWTLVEGGAVSPEDLAVTLEAQIQGAVFEAVSWRRGVFSFEEETHPGAHDPVPGLRLDTQKLLLEALRCLDEKGRDEPPSNLRVGPWSRTEDLRPERDAAPLAPSSRASREAFAAAIDAGPWPAVAVVTADPTFVTQLGIELAESAVAVLPVDLAGLGGAAEESPALVVLDLRGPLARSDWASAIRRANPAPVIAVVAISANPAAAADTAAAYEAGAVAVVPGQISAVAACIKRLSRRAPRFAGARGDRQLMGRLRRVLGDIRSGLYSATLSLSLMNLVAESAERAVLFLVRRERFAALGAFGFREPSGPPLSEVVRDLQLTAADASLFNTVIAAGHLRSVGAGELPAALLTRIGRPRSGEAILLPVLGQETVIALLYADNGPFDAPLCDLDVLEVATGQVGLAFENELLRRRLRDA